MVGGWGDGRLYPLEERHANHRTPRSSPPHKSRHEMIPCITNRPFSGRTTHPKTEGLLGPPPPGLSTSTLTLPPARALRVPFKLVMDTRPSTSRFRGNNPCSTPEPARRRPRHRLVQRNPPSTSSSNKTSDSRIIPPESEIYYRGRNLGMQSTSPFVFHRTDMDGAHARASTPETSRVSVNAPSEHCACPLSQRKHQIVRCTVTSRGGRSSSRLVRVPLE